MAGVAARWDKRLAAIKRLAETTYRETSAEAKSEGG
jgi:hypothetical protein